MACLNAGLEKQGTDILLGLLPGGRDHDVYLREPYVLCADVYSAPGAFGQGGWGWYTGASGWFLRACTEELLGVRIYAREITVSPRLRGYACTLRLPEAVYRIEAGEGPASEILLDGAPVKRAALPRDGANHALSV